MDNIISGKNLAAKLKGEVAACVAEGKKKYGREPHLVVILVGEDPGSVSYVTGKAKDCEEVGFRNTTLRYPDTISEEELLARIAELNADEGVDGVLVQLPLPRHIDEEKVIAAIDKRKDVDGFHPLNVASLWQKQSCLLPCTPKGIIKMLDESGIQIEGKKAVVIGRSNIVGDGAAVIDVGVNRDPETGKLCGDVDFEACRGKASVITPVPGGVGPMTRACLMENTLECYLDKMNSKR